MTPQHFLRRAYLEGFQDPALERKGKTAIWLYKPGKQPIPQALERVAKRNYYYRHRQENHGTSTAANVAGNPRTQEQP
jgi:hypothetical protein